MAGDVLVRDVSPASASRPVSLPDEAATDGSALLSRGLGDEAATDGSAVLSCGLGDEDGTFASDVVGGTAVTGSQWIMGVGSCTSETAHISSKADENDSTAPASSVSFVGGCWAAPAVAVGGFF